MSKREVNLEDLWKKIFWLENPDFDDDVFKHHHAKLSKHLCMANYHIKCLNERGANHSIDLIDHSKDS